VTSPALVASCWTSAGDALPAGECERSPLPLAERVRAVAASGWTGLGLLHADLDGLSPADLAELGGLVRSEGLSHVEVELLDGWWDDDESAWRPRWTLLLSAARALGAALVKATPPPAGHAGDLAPRLRALADEAAASGTRLALEPVPWAAVASIPSGADLVREVDHPAFGLVVDAWHVFRAGTSLEELAASLSGGARPLVLAVELDDADADVVGTLFEDTRDHRRYCGEGSFDLTGLVRVLRAAGFDGPWGVEALSDEHRALHLGDALVRARDAALTVLLDPRCSPSNPSPPEASP
jgi:sugar phosphate isomerase/epimerase